jgi:MFS family permease
LRERGPRRVDGLTLIASKSGVVSVEASARLYGPPYLALLAVTLLGFASYSIVQTVLPLYVLELGGNATVVGFVVAAFSFPSVALRPVVGRLVDEWSRRGVHLAGTICLGVAGFLYMAPSVGAVLLTRVVHGVGWAAFNTGGGTAVAELAPATRRGEAAGMYNLMPGIANMVMPAAGLLLLASQGFVATFLAAGLIGLLAAVILWFGPLPPDRKAAGRERAGVWSSLVERQALLPMSLEFLFTLTTTLFWVYPPVFARALDIPVEQLTNYYVLVGVAVVLSRLIAGRYMDRLARRTALLLGAAMTACALATAGLATSVAVLALAGIFHAIATSLITPAAMAIAIEGSRDDRRGAAIATYSLGYQLGIGAGGFLWGAVIDAFGFPGPYLVAFASPLLLATAVVRNRAVLSERSMPG